MPKKKDEIAAYDEARLQALDLEGCEGRCERALEILIPELAHEPRLLRDYARIAAFLMCCDARAALRALDTAVKREAKRLRKRNPHGRVSISKLLRALLVPAGFADQGGVYFVGDAGKAFGRVVGAKMLFVDGLSFVHGEFSHSIQWLLVHQQNQSQAGWLQTPVCDLYRRSIEWTSSETLLAEQGGALKPKKIAVWDFCVDCFVPRTGQACNVLQTLFSDSARSPAFVQALLTRGDSKDTELGKLLRERDQRRTFDGALTLEQARVEAFRRGSAVGTDDLAGVYRARATLQMQQPPHKPRMPFPGAESGALVPDPLFPVRHGTKPARDAAQRPEGALFNPAELDQMERAMKPGPRRERREKATDPLERAWLELWGEK